MLQNSTIVKLCVDGNSSTGEGIHILAGFMQLCPHLQILRSSHCGITSDDFKSLLDLLTNFKDSSDTLSQLLYWDLSNNCTNDNSAIILLNHLPSLFPHLGYAGTGPGVNFSGNHIGSDILRRIKEEMERRFTVIQNDNTECF